MKSEEKFIGDISLWTYQNLDGSNTTNLIASAGQKVGKFNLTGGMGLFMNTDDSSGVIFEGKSQYSINDKFGVQLRVRDIYSGDVNNIQVRLSPNYEQPIGEKTSIYVNPYIAEKINTCTGDAKTDVGIFAGAKHKLGKRITLFGEAQAYNLHTPKLSYNKENWTGNVGVNFGVKCAF